MAGKTRAAGARQGELRAGEREFGIEELFFSMTDRKGIIRSSNDIFVRVSGYAGAELVGQPHNIIRHPDMPRAIFKLFWDEIGAGRPIAAYVKNRAKDGRHYWVMATAAPIDGGYLSVRLKPSTPYFDVAQAIYRRLRAIEEEIEGGEPRRRKQAIEAAGARLGELLSEAGYASYAAFMRAALPAEVKRRAELVGADARRQPAAPPGADPALRRAFDACVTVGAFLDGLIGKLDQYAALNGKLLEKALFAHDLAEDVRLFSLNALLAATRASGGGATLKAVAALMRARSDASAPVFRSLTDDVAAAVGWLDSLIFPIAATKLQAEMTMAYVGEVLAGGEGAAAAAYDLVALAQCLADGVDRIVASLASLDGRTQALTRDVARLKADLGVLRALELNGRVEAARSGDAGEVVTLFRAIADQLTAAHGELADLSNIRTASFDRDAAEATRIGGQVSEIREQMAALSVRRAPAASRCVAGRSAR